MGSLLITILQIFYRECANERILKQETRMLSQALNRVMPHSRNQLEGVDRKKLIFFYLAVQLYH